MDIGENIVVFLFEFNLKDILYLMGILFCLFVRNNNFEIQICVIWVRYFQVEENQWKREVRVFVFGLVEVFVLLEKENRSRWKLKIDKDGEIVLDDIFVEVCLYIDSKKIVENFFYVSIYLVNVIQNELGKNSDEKKIFQLQICIVCVENIKVELMQIDIKDVGMEDEEINFFYRNFFFIVKGYFCLVVWREIDLVGWLNENSMSEYLFGWLDGRIVVRKYGEEIYWKFFLLDL